MHPVFEGVHHRLPGTDERATTGEVRETGQRWRGGGGGLASVMVGTLYVVKEAYRLVDTGIRLFQGCQHCIIWGSWNEININLGNRHRQLGGFCAFSSVVFHLSVC